MERDFHLKSHFEVNLHLPCVRVCVYAAKCWCVRIFIIKSLKCVSRRRRDTILGKAKRIFAMKKGDGEKSESEKVFHYPLEFNLDPLNGSVKSCWVHYTHTHANTRTQKLNLIWLLDTLLMRPSHKFHPISNLLGEMATPANRGHVIKSRGQTKVYSNIDWVSDRDWEYQILKESQNAIPFSPFHFAVSFSQCNCIPF